MKSITLTDVIQEECRDEAFSTYFKREILINEIAKLVVDLRHQAKLTQRELAKKIGTTQPVIARLESGLDHRVPSLELLVKLAAAVNYQLKIVAKKQTLPR